MEHPPTYSGFSMRGGRCQSHRDEKSDLESQQRSTVVCSAPGTGGYRLTDLHRQFERGGMNGASVSSSSSCFTRRTGQSSLLHWFFSTLDVEPGSLR